MGAAAMGCCFATATSETPSRENQEPQEAASGDELFFPTCQVRVVRFYVSLLRLRLLVLLLFLLVLRLLRRRAVGPLPDLNRDSLR